jgi:hypothetical protein
LNLTTKKSQSCVKIVKLLIEKAVTIVAIIFSSISLVGVIYLILPRDQTGSEWWRNPGRILADTDINN